MNKINSENISNPKNIENDEKNPKEITKDNKKEYAKDESNIILNPCHTSEKLEDNLDIFSQDNLTSNLKDYEKYCNEENKENEPKTFGNTEVEIKEEFKKTESTESDSQIDLKTNSSTELSLQENKNKNKNIIINTNIITISLYKQKIQNIIQKTPDYLFKTKKKMSKESFYEILRAHSLGGFIEKIEFVLKEENSEDKAKINDETVKNNLNDNSSDTSYSATQYYYNSDVNEIIEVKNNIFENSTLVESLNDFTLPY